MDLTNIPAEQLLEELQRRVRTEALEHLKASLTAEQPLPRPLQRDVERAAQAGPGREEQVAALSEALRAAAQLDIDTQCRALHRAVMATEHLPGRPWSIAPELDRPAALQLLREAGPQVRTQLAAQQPARPLHLGLRRLLLGNGPALEPVLAQLVRQATPPAGPGNEELVAVAGPAAVKAAQSLRPEWSAQQAAAALADSALELLDHRYFNWPVVASRYPLTQAAGALIRWESRELDVGPVITQA